MYKVYLYIGTFIQWLICSLKLIIAIKMYLEKKLKV